MPSSEEQHPAHVSTPTTTHDQAVGTVSGRLSLLQRMRNYWCAEEFNANRHPLDPKVVRSSDAEGEGGGREWPEEIPETGTQAKDALVCSVGYRSVSDSNIHPISCSASSQSPAGSPSVPRRFS